MRVLLLGSTGALGSRFIPALLSYSHTITALVRNETKLRSLLPPSVFSESSLLLRIEVGTATDTQNLIRIIQAHDIEAIVSAAGAASLFGSGSELLAIDDAIIAAVRQSGRQMKRLWMMGGWLLLDWPGSGAKSLLYD
jgi:putative NADH-flavin reductase